MKLDFTIIKGDYIALTQLLKAVKLTSSGGEAKMLVDDGAVYLNGKQEFRRRAKIRPGDKIEIDPNYEDIVINIK
ncbi:MAG: RNA-binding S4 domain-containing protein [Prevotellaceae bacterium]|jgi:ribosome-associated protein|nr:RNA-binding S4 domain-containing protein [Prevotellaceae bacterium]